MNAPANRSAGRIPPGRLRELGPISWVIAKLGARTAQAPEMHLFTTLGQRRLLFWAWTFYGARLLRGRLPAVDTELVILRVAHLRGSEYELQHHRRLGRRRGLDDHAQAAIFAWPKQANGLSDRQRALLDATDQFVTDRTIGDEAWLRLSGELDRQQLIEFCLLAGHYDGLAATLAALEVPLDHPR
jgi:AhpD family alkylhydroperoxidase